MKPYLLAKGRLEGICILHHRPVVLHLNGRPLLQIGYQILRILGPHLRLLKGNVHALGVTQEAILGLHLQGGGRLDGAPTVLRMLRLRENVTVRRHGN